MQRAFLIGYAKGLHEAGMSCHEIARRTEVPRPTIIRWRQNGFQFVRRPGSGRPRATTARDERLIARQAQRDAAITVCELRTAIPHASSTTLRRRLKQLGYRSIKRPSRVPLNNRHKISRLQWAMKHCLWRERQWSRVVWTDEASVCLSARDGRLRLWVKRSCKVPEQLMVPRCQGGGGRILIWGAIWSTGRSQLHVMHETMNAERYVAVLRSHIPSICDAMGNPATDWILMEDNATPHTSRIATAAKSELHLRRMSWPPKSPDLNPIEHVWAWLKLHVRRQLRPCHTIANVEEMVVRGWTEMPQQIIDSVVSSMTSRVATVIKEKGGNTRY